MALVAPVRVASCKSKNTYGGGLLISTIVGSCNEVNSQILFHTLPAAVLFHTELLKCDIAQRLRNEEFCVLRR